MRRATHAAPGLPLLLALADPAAQEVRRRLLEAVQRYPGLHLRELARHADIAPQHAQYHLRVLERVDLVHVEREAGHVRYYATESSPVGLLPTVGQAERERLDLLRRPHVLRIVVVLLAEGPLALTDLARRLRVAPSTAHHHLNALSGKNVVQRDPQGAWDVVDRPGLRALLLAHEPPPAWLEGYLDAWSRLAP